MSNMTKVPGSDEPHGTLTHSIIGAAMEVHRALGPGLLESVYETCICRELALRHIRFERQVSVPVKYKGVVLETGCRLDILVEESVVVELKAVDALTGVHEAQLLSYMKLSGTPVGLLINFNEAVLKRGLKRMVL
jgi:GxxExxY protein